MDRILVRLRPSPAMVVACTALLFALTWAGYAAGMLGPNTVGTKQLKKNAVISSKVKNRSLLAADFKAGQLPAGPKGDKGDKGDPGAPGAPNPNANTLNGFAANQLVRATSATAGTLANEPCNSLVLDNFGSTTFTNVVSKSVTAPVAGIFVISGRVGAEFDSGSPAGSFLRLLGRLAVDGVQAGPQNETSLAGSPENCSEGRTIALSQAIPVTAGNHTVAVQVAKSTTAGGTGLAWVANGSVTVVFVPFGNDGVQGVLAPGHVPAKQGAASNR
jgi:hypothetical protein